MDCIQFLHIELTINRTALKPWLFNETCLPSHLIWLAEVEAPTPL
ncbi:hypothetical protein HMPREF0454_01405 [Hafnia alvei ATCC 51873]|uniref:Uncharacterized protein n=1 Tax=Hafnia alvei ATCC 51873 TaxID=1002364 RepID=G9Y4E1_HAFAL|nr:hypothetical protein HMPREF0454_01405 [Hafnia alvei ATCC 51873]